MTYALNLKCPTVFKRQPVQSIALPPEDKAAIHAGSFKVVSYTDAGDHWRVVLDRSNLVKKMNTWFVYKSDVNLLGSDGSQVASSVLLSGITYFDQRDNAEDPFYTCNVTSIAMILSFYGIKGKSSDERLPDELDDYMTAQGWNRESHDDLVKLVAAYGHHDTFDCDTPFEVIKDNLLHGNPCVISGRFTGGGHIMPVIGFDSTGFIVNDPYGEWTSDGYINKSGEKLHYSYDLFNAVTYSGTDHMWAHLLSR